MGCMQEKGEELTAKQRQVQAASVEATLEYVQGISVIKSFNMAEKNLSGIEKAYEKSMEASYALERDFAPMNVAYSMVFRVAACAIILVSSDFRFRRGTGFFKPCGYPHCFILYFQFCRGNGANDRHDTLHGSKP